MLPARCPCQILTSEPADPVHETIGTPRHLTEGDFVCNCIVLHCCVLYKRQFQSVLSEMNRYARVYPSIIMSVGSDKTRYFND
jgi:hypothetical protein